MGDSCPKTEVAFNPEKLEHPTLAFFREYWDSKRAGRAMPARKDISPSEVREHLGWMILIDVLPEMKDFRYRLIGTLVTQYFNTDATGALVSEAWSVAGPDRVRSMLALLRHVAGSAAIVHLKGSKDWESTGFEEFESLYLPLSDDGKTVNHVLNVFVFDKHAVLMAREISRTSGERPAPAGTRRGGRTN